MNTLTKEWLLKTIAELEEERDAVPGVVNEDAAMALAAMKLALASLEAEPVALRDERSGSGGISKKPGFNDLQHGTPLYTAPPAPVAMKDHQIRELVNELRDIAVKYHGSQQLREHIARTIRAAMLQGVDGNSPVIPDGWVACSERMPNIGVPVITCCGDVVQYAAYAWDGKEWQDWYEEYDKLPANTFTHWHPRPAAPQQEVK